VSELLVNSEVWKASTAAETGLKALNDRQLLELQQVLDEDLAALLTYLGYRPPPPAHRMERDLHNAIDHAIAPTRIGHTQSAMTAHAKQNLFVFAYRLREVTRNAEQQLDADNESDGGRRLAISAQDLRVVVRTAVRAAGQARSLLLRRHWSFRPLGQHLAYMPRRKPPGKGSSN
jgi:hypothetical protein